MPKIKFYITISIISMSSVLLAQSPVIDSLNGIIETSPDDTSKVNSIIELCIEIIGNDPEEAILLADQAKELSEQLNFKKGLALAYKYLGLAYSSQNLYLQATLQWKESQKVFEELGDQDGISNILSNLGTLYSNQGDDEKALELYLQSLEIAEAIDAKMRILTVSLNIGLIYQKKKATLDKALEYYSVALKLAEELEYIVGIGYASVNTGEVYFQQEDFSIALSYFERSREALQNSGALPYPMIWIGKVYAKRGEYDKARNVQQEAFDIAEEANSKLYMAMSLLGLADTHVQEGNINEALTTWGKAEPIAEEIGSKESLKEAYEGLSKYYAQLNDFHHAYLYQEKLTAVNDSLFISANEKRLDLMMTNYSLNQMEKEVQVQELTIQKQKLAKNAFLIGLVLILVIAFIIFRNYLAKVKTNRLLDKQNEEIEGLLMNILPEEVARELQRTGHATPRDYQSVSVLFTDFKGFSSIAKGLHPNELVDELSSFFIGFDSIIEKHNLEKIKTIGDAYMCAGGIPSPNESHPLDTVRAGLEMQQFMEASNQKRIAEGKQTWELRIGIHTGPLVAGVVGKKKYAYDIWGTTVNIASRMESNGEAGKVNVSEATYHQISQEFNCQHRGKISAKNVGEIDMYFVNPES